MAARFTFNVATGLANVVGLVFVAAFAPDEGERLAEVTAGSTDSALSTAQVALAYPTPDGGRDRHREFAIDPAQFHQVFAADLPPAQAAVLAATQRPVSELKPPSRRACPPGGRRPGRCSHPDKAAGTDVVRPWPSAPAPPSPRSRAPTSS